jgi:hypothetical protein
MGIASVRRCSPDCDTQLMAEKQVLGLEPAPRLEDVVDERHTAHQLQAKKTWPLTGINSGKNLSH